MLALIVGAEPEPDRVDLLSTLVEKMMDEIERLSEKVDGMDVLESKG